MKQLLCLSVIMIALTILQDQLVGAEGFTEQKTSESRGDSDTKKTDDRPDHSACEGKPIVTMEETFEDGTKVFEQVVRLDNDVNIKHGLTTSYWSDGTKRMEVEYACGKLHGMKVSYFVDGSRRSVGEYVNGKSHGTWIEWYKNGKKAKRFSMRYGAWYGTFTLWYSSGQKRLEVEYVNGQRQGRQYSWDEEGNVIHQLDYVDNKPQPTPRA